MAPQSDLIHRCRLLARNRVELGTAIPRAAEATRGESQFQSAGPDEGFVFTEGPGLARADIPDPRSCGKVVDIPFLVAMISFCSTPCVNLSHRAVTCCKLQRRNKMAVISDDGVVRVTASLGRTQEAALKELALKHKVSVAWLVRYAIDMLVEQGREAQLPLDFGRRV